MNIIIKPYTSLPCRLDVFTIDDIDADMDWFVNSYDHRADIAEPYCCEDRRADNLNIVEVRTNIKNTPFENLTDEDIIIIQRKLCDELAIGSCGWCI
jgi:hypothetical protein